MQRRVLVDANIVISFMMALGRERSLLHRVLRAGLARQYRLLLGEETMREVEASYRRKRHLQDAIPPEEFFRAMTLLRQRAETVATLPGPPSPYCRDPRDDYLIALALENAVTHLLTGDRDLLALDGRFPFRILDSADLAAELGIPVP